MRLKIEPLLNHYKGLLYINYYIWDNVWHTVTVGRGVQYVPGGFVYIWMWLLWKSCKNNDSDFFSNTCFVNGLWLLHAWDVVGKIIRSPFVLFILFSNQHFSSQWRSLWRKMKWFSKINSLRIIKTSFHQLKSLSLELKDLPWYLQKDAQISIS